MKKIVIYIIGIFFLCVFVISCIQLGGEDSSVVGQGTSHDLVYKSILAVIRKDQNAYLECY